jgi:hypothetical protein
LRMFKLSHFFTFFLYQVNMRNSHFRFQNFLTDNLKIKLVNQNSADNHQFII